jgi:hypothetical protein
MKINKETLKQLIMEELNEMPEFRPSADDIAFGLSHDAAASVVNRETVENELSSLSPKETDMLENEIRDAVSSIIKTYLNKGN